MRVKFLSIFRTIFYIPVVLPIVVTTILWTWMFNPNGFINSILLIFNIHGPNWLSTPQWVKPSLIIMGLWPIGNTVVIYLSALQDVPESLIEAAELDGAGPIRKLVNIIIPMISHIIFFNIILGIIAGFQYFMEPFIMLGGDGTSQSGLFYSTYLYQNAFQNFKMGYASAMGWILFIIVLILTGLVFKSSARLVYYAGDDK